MKKAGLLLMALVTTVALTLSGCGGANEEAPPPSVAAARDRGGDSVAAARGASGIVPAAPAVPAPVGPSREEVSSFPPAVDARGLDDDSAADTPDDTVAEDTIALVDTDGDGVHDELDAFPLDPAQWTDKRQRRQRR